MDIEDLLPAIEAEQDVLSGYGYDDYDQRKKKLEDEEYLRKKMTPTELRELSARVADSPVDPSGMSKTWKDDQMANFALALGDVLGTGASTALLEEGIKPVSKMKLFKDIKAVKPTKRVVERPEVINKWNPDQIMVCPYSRDAVDNRYPARYYNAYNEGNTYAFYPEWSEHGIPTGRPNFEDIKSVNKTRSVTNKSDKPKMTHDRINKAWEGQPSDFSMDDLPPADEEALKTAWRLSGDSFYDDAYIPKGYKPTHEKKYYKKSSTSEE